MAVFKRRDWTENDKKNTWYGKEPGNISHIGLVVSINPLQIIHASSVERKVTIDTKIKLWAYCGTLKDVNYNEEVIIKVEYMYVNTASGSLNMRKTASKNGSLIAQIPRGASVAIIEKGTDWCKVTYNGETGYVMTQYLSSAAPSGESKTSNTVISIPKDTAITLYEALKYSLKL